MEKMTKENTYNALILLTLISFGFFGSLSHLFSLALIILMAVDHTKSNKKNDSEYKNILLFCILSGSFFLFFLTSLFHNDFRIILTALSPMLPIPFIGLLIIFHKGIGFKITSKKLSQFSQISIFFLLAIYVLLKIFAAPDSSLHGFHTGRLTVFSGNPIPFSYCVLGISIFCLANWHHSNRKSKLVAFILFLSGIYFAGVLSGTRGTLLTLFLVAPIIIFCLSGKLKTTLLIISAATLSFIILSQVKPLTSLENVYLNRITNGIETLALSENRDRSVWLRLDMWSAGLKAFIEAPILGHGITERFTALKPYLKNSEINYTHPHNDIIAGFVSSGIFGGIAVFILLMSSVSAAIVAPMWNYTKFYFALMISCSAMVTGSVSTVLFNDISSAWLVFSTYLILAADFKDEPQN